MKANIIIAATLILVCVGCAAKNYSTMTDNELIMSLAKQQEGYNQNTANYHKWSGSGDPDLYIGSRSAVAGANLGAGLGRIMNAVVSAKSAQINKEEVDKIRQEIKKRGLIK